MHGFPTKGTIPITIQYLHVMNKKIGLNFGIMNQVPLNGK